MCYADAFGRASWYLAEQDDILKLRLGAKKAVTKDWFGKVRPAWPRLPPPLQPLWSGVVASRPPSPRRE
jgi:hypothetical protein